MKTDSRLKRRAGQAGFTLVEILVVLIIITILAGIVGVNVIPKLAESKVKAAGIQIKNLQTALKIYYTEQGRYPSQAQGLSALIVAPTIEPVPKNYPADGYLEGRTVPLDPWNKEFIYLAPGRQNEPYEIISYGSDNEPGGEGDAEDLSSSGK